MRKLAYVTNTDSDDISVIDLADNRELGRIAIGGSPRGCMAIDPMGYYGYVSNCAGNTISVIDLMRNQEVTRIIVGLAPRGVAMTAEGSYLFVSNSGSNDVSIIDLRTREERTRIPVANNPRALSITPDGRYVCVPCWAADCVSVIEVAEDIVQSKEIGRVELGADAKPYHAAADPGSELAFTANTHRHSVSVINLLDMKVVAEVPVGFGPRGVLPDPDAPFVYVSCEASNVVSVIDKETWREVEQIEVGPTPRGMKLDAIRRLLLVAAFSRGGGTSGSLQTHGNALTVVDLTKRAAVGAIKTGFGPCSVNIYDPAQYQVRDRQPEAVDANR